MAKLKQSALQPDAEAPGAPRIAAQTELGYPGIKYVQKQILEESVTKLRMPHLISTIDEMKRDSTIMAALSFYKMMLSRVKWDVKAPVGASAKEQERAKFIRTCMDDMDVSWFDFITETLSVIDYGFCVVEKVYKRRSKNNSAYDDGLVGWASLPTRAQSSLDGWKFSEDGRELEGFVQSLSTLNHSGRFSNVIATEGSTKTIPRNKFLLFRTSPQGRNPEGTAALKASYIAWRYKKMVEEQEAIGLGRDLGGLLSVSMPARYMSPDASTAEKAVYEEYKRVVRNVANGEQSGIIIPSDHDPETKTAMFKLELLTSQGGKSYDTSTIIQRYASQMLISLFADLLQLGSGATGSFALAGSKQDLITFALDHRLREIKNVLDSDLVPQTYALNGWEQVNMPEFVYEPLDPISLDELGKFIQRVSAVSMLEGDRQILNITRTAVGADALPEDVEPQEEYLNKSTSRSGDGMESGMPSGTGDATGESGDSSTGNTENAE